MRGGEREGGRGEGERERGRVGGGEERGREGGRGRGRGEGERGERGRKRGEMVVICVLGCAGLYSLNNKDKDSHLCR